MTNAKTWFNKALYDFDAAKDMLKCKKYDYTVFFCHQALEKALKSIFINENAQMPPYIHNLMKLAEVSNLWPLLKSEAQDFLEEINPYYIELRYPTTEQIDKIDLTHEQAEGYLNRTEELLEWLKTKKKF